MNANNRAGGWLPQPFDNLGFLQCFFFELSFDADCLIG